MASHADSRPAARVPLSRERVLDAAVLLADEAGIESLSMRKLARELGVEAMSLYNHVANKRDLVDGIVDLALNEIELPPAVEEWDVAIRKCAISAHETLLRHPWACSLVMSPSTFRIEGSPRVRYMEWLLRRLREAGFSPELTYHAYHALDSHILGFTMWQLGHMAGVKNLAERGDLADFAATIVQELRGHELTYLAEHAEQHLVAPSDDGARQFEFGLDLILHGVKRISSLHAP
jgi:AcrR family transcriptional regulator